MAYCVASLAMDLNGMVYHLVLLLQLPARTLPRTRGERNRITRDINSRVSKILREREDFAENPQREARIGTDLMLPVWCDVPPWSDLVLSCELLALWGNQTYRKWTTKS